MKPNLEHKTTFCELPQSKTQIVFLLGKLPNRVKRCHVITKYIYTDIYIWSVTESRVVLFSDFSPSWCSLPPRGPSPLLRLPVPPPRRWVSGLGLGFLWDVEIRRPPDIPRHGVWGPLWGLVRAPGPWWGWGWPRGTGDGGGLLFSSPRWFLGVFQTGP